MEQNKMTLRIRNGDLAARRSLSAAVAEGIRPVSQPAVDPGAA